MAELELAGKTAIVTAASRGLGREIALKLSASGAKVGICSSDRIKINRSAQKIAEQTGGQVYAQAVDLSRPEEVVGFARNVAEQLGNPDIFVSNSPPPRPGMFSSLSEADWRQAFDLVVMSAVLLTREVLPAMRARKWGRLIYLASGSVLRPMPHVCLSNVMRAGVVALGRSLVNEVGVDGVTVNSVLVGNIETERHRQLVGIRAKQVNEEYESFYRKDAAKSPLGRFGQPSELAEVIAFLSSDKGGFVHGAMLSVDGGWSEIPVSSA